MAVILKQSDVEKFRNISNNFNQDKFDAFANEIQTTQLRELLGNALHYKLIADLDASGIPQNTPYTTLVNGEVYTYDGDSIEYFGLKPFLTYHWLALNVREGDFFQSDYGNIQFSDNPQDHMQKISQGTIDRIASSYMKNVTSYRNNIVQYLNEKDSTYPEWEGRRENKAKSQFNSFTI